jgi:hypothetical protein
LLSFLELVSPLAAADTIPEQVLFNRSQQQHDDRGDNREQSTSARQKAEALFTRKPQLIEPSVRETAPAGEAVRKPRVLAVSTPGPVQHDEPEAPISANPPMTPVIPAAQFARVRAWSKYGMTAAQVAEVYGVAASEIERILRIA